MPRPRKDLVCVADTPYYHVISRCVRRAFLCGIDRYSGQNFDHRKPWLVDRIEKLSSVFSIGICSYAIMANHYHLVVKIDEETTSQWTDRDVVERWKTVFYLPFMIQAWFNGDSLDEGQSHWVQNQIADYRQRLCDLSWYMRCLNEFIARKANKEDRCTGRFWEGRYKSQALLDEPALLTAMAYVDLNPIRANIAKSPETSDFTAIQRRIRQEPMTGLVLLDKEAAKQTLDNKATERVDTLDIPFTLTEYLELVDYTGRIVRKDKAGAISGELPPILERLGMSSDDWEHQFQGFNQRPRVAYGSLERLQLFCQRIKQQWLWGMGQIKGATPRVKPLPG